MDSIWQIRKFEESQNIFLPKKINSFISIFSIILNLLLFVSFLCESVFVPERQLFNGVLTTNEIVD